MSVDIEGRCEAPWRPLQQAFADNFEAGRELGASLAIYENEQLVVDLWGGFADRKRTRPWTEHSVANVFSSGKVMLNACMLKLVSDGGMDLDDPVTRFWPEYAANGKGATTLRHVMTHTAGVPAFDPPQAFEALHDWSHITGVLAAGAPMFEPGTRLCYHPMTHGFILGELLRRVDGRMLSDYFRDEFAAPMALDFRMRLDDDLAPRRVQQLWTWHPPEPDDLRMRILASAEIGPPEAPERLFAEMPSGNAVGNARAMARFGAMLAQDGELDGRRYIDAGTVRQARSLQVEDEDPMLGLMRMGLGFGLDSSMFEAPTKQAFHWGGMGGSFMIMVPEHRLAIAYAMNHYVTEGANTFDERQPRFWEILKRELRDR